ncbi:hypothetical protein [Ruegeria sp. HKCCA5929]|uniref:hypothetical protein n=1 Tax=Ruegeria sp. HKCCA5929 TaxID=2682988 RepID=UPI001487870C|nr:hypothetical protein [Ruegeria sp. HKCCA5929]
MSDHSVIDYDNIRGSAERNLGAQNEGWVELVARCFEAIKKHCDREELPYPRVAQIKQKFGGLRIYLHDGETGDDLMIDEFIHAACNTADSSCEMCGNSSRPQSIGGWVRNLCCFCVHAEARRQERDLTAYPLNDRVEHRLKCLSCGYLGQLVTGRDDKKCAACVIGELEK